MILCIWKNPLPSAWNALAKQILMWERGERTILQCYLNKNDTTNPSEQRYWIQPLRFIRKNALKILHPVKITHLERWSPQNTFIAVKWHVMNPLTCFALPSSPKRLPRLQCARMISSVLYVFFFRKHTNWINIAPFISYSVVWPAIICKFSSAQYSFLKCVSKRVVKMNSHFQICCTIILIEIQSCSDYHNNNTDRNAILLRLLYFFALLAIYYI